MPDVLGEKANGVVESLNVDGPGEFGVSDAETMLNQARALLA